MSEIMRKNLDELTQDDVQSLVAMGYELICNDGHVLGIMRNTVGKEK